MGDKAPKYVSFKNVSKRRVVIEDLGIDVRPGEECVILEGYGMPRIANSGGRRPSIIEDLATCPGCPEMAKGSNPDGSPNHVAHCLLEPSKEEDRERFGRAPDSAPNPHVKTKMPTIADLVAAGVPRGVAEQLVKAAIAAAQTVKDGDDAVEVKEEAPKAKAPAPKKPDAQ